MKKKIIVLSVSILIVSTFLIWVKYQGDMQVSYDRVQGKSSIIATSYGNLEYTEGGVGPDVLVIHGGGGGYDQGELLARTVLGEKFRCITPSRFGYLGSSLPEGATYDDQAHAYAKLLDHLKVERAAVIGFSAGGPSALLFALLHPDRVSSLTLISAGATNVSEQAGKQGIKQGKMLSNLMQRDFPYWVSVNLFKKQIMQLMGANKEVIATLSQEQIKVMDQVIDYMNPAALRKSGAAFDHYAALPNERIAGIRTPTLVVHAEDDTLQPYQNAVFTSSTIPGARLLSFENGGHFAVAIEQSTISREVYKHISNAEFETEE
ncbi:alpha/beta fold hydrolase [Phosphitispora fastidiosa]|uniref:alpha/beta fold hydrolase n=1 Tax=Phosphitispora fastidiosa TaxID=2837202 RepID=UPI001E6318F1|nr:pimeloyl-ACP methyl ester carboxylesterase [Phosphitispora fastidiosa]